MKIRLKELREQKLMLQSELSASTGIAEATISRIEQGKQEPRIPTIRKLAKALGVDPGELVCKDDPKP